MNFVKRAAMSLRARKSRTAGLLAIFVVLCTLLLGGFLLQAAAARQEADAQRRVGVDVTVRGKGLTPAAAARLGASPEVNRYNPLVPLRAGAQGFAPLTSPGPRPGGKGTDDAPLALSGVRDSGLLLPFSYGTTKVTAGRGIEPGDAGRDVALVERRLAERNRLEVGDTVRLRSADGKRLVPVEVVGVYRDPMPDPSQWTAPHQLPGNNVYVPVGTVQRLGAPTTTASEAVFRIGSPEQAERLHSGATRLLGAGTFDFRVNDKAYKDQVRPVQRVGTLAGLIVWVIALAGALVLGLIVLLQVRERRHELGVLLAMGEKKWKLIGQQVLEVSVVALPAVGVAALIGLLAGPYVSDALPGPERRPGPAADAADALPAPVSVRVDPASVGKVAGIGLGISLAATVIPGVGVLRLHPRSIVTDDE
ncbi:ABC transporter permease [Streptomyces sp. NPDC001941]|uniref:ABC transporter permease n=1 Tax=Streptomyces sp. NPDC001941 TaxID=3154659 RepID=UPI003324CD87